MQDGGETYPEEVGDLHGEDPSAVRTDRPHDPDDARKDDEDVEEREYIILQSKLQWCECKIGDDVDE